MILAMYTPTRTAVEVVQDGEERAYVKFPTGRVLWVPAADLDFDRIGDDDWGPENDDSLGFDSPTDWDEYEMNPDDCMADAGDQYDFEYDR